MRLEKKYLVEEVSEHLEKSTYVFFTNFDRITVAETATLRSSLSEFGAEFHVVKNSVLNVAAQERDLPSLNDYLAGPTAIVVGGDAPAEVAKVLQRFLREKGKLEIKGGILDRSLLTSENVIELTRLPGRNVLRAQLLGVLISPAQGIVTVLQGVPQGLVNVLNGVPRGLFNVLHAKADLEH